MAPKKGAKKPVKQDEGVLAKPVVSPDDIARAKKALEDEKFKKRANSNMHYWLQSQGRKAEFDQMTPKQRKEFFDSWIAQKLKSGETTSSGIKDIGTKKQDGSTYQWVSKHQLIQLLGEDKAKARIASGKMQTRADPVTGLSDEWSLEYKLVNDVGSDMSFDKTGHRLQTDKAVEGDAAKVEALEDMNAASMPDDGGSSSSGLVQMKQELADGAPSGVVQKEQSEADKKLEKTITTLTKNPRQVLKAIGETVTSLKCMFEGTANGRYTESLHEDIGKLLPKFKIDFRAVEQIVTKPDSFGSGNDEAFILAVATKLEKNFDQYNELCDWHAKFSPDKKKQKKS